MKKLNLIMPMGGGGTRFLNNGYECPKPLIDLCGRPFFYYAAKSVSDYVKLGSITFVVLKDHVERFNIDKEVLKYFPDAYIEIIEEVLPGAVLTCMRGVEHLTDDNPVIFNDCDHSFLCNKFYEFCKDGFVCENSGRDDDGDNSLSYVKPDRDLLKIEPDGALLTFESDEDKFSFAAFDDDGFVTRTVEKQVISRDAICGAYYFKNKDIFLKNAEEYLTNCSYKEFFMSGVYNVMCSHGLKVTAFRTDGHTSFGTPDEYEQVRQMWTGKNAL